jgi:hypothetical protein
MELQSHKKKVLEQFRRNYIMIISFLLIFIAGMIVGIGVYEKLTTDNIQKVLATRKIVQKLTEKDKIKNQKSLLNDLPNTNGNVINGKLTSTENVKIAPFNSRKVALHIFEEDIIIFKGDVQWEEPKNIKNLGLTINEIYAGCANANNPNVRDEDACPEGVGISTGMKYIKVGLITNRRFKDYEIIFVKTGYAEGPGGDTLLTMLKKDRDIIFLLDENTRYMAEILGKYFDEGDYQVQVMAGIKFEELSVPEIINDNKKGAKFVKNKYERGFFDKTNLQASFQHPVYGTVWMTKPVNSKKSELELNSYKEYDYKNKKFVKKYKDIFDDNGFYIKLPNGMAVSYKLVLDDITESQERFGVIKAIWDDDTTNIIEYELNPSGCGSTSYIYNVTGLFNIKTDLVPIGKTENGKILYGFKNTSTEDFKKLYEDIYHARDGEKKSKEEFLLIHPKVFYVDPYNRLIAFYRADILSPAECGKPVIYLYPEKAMNINVQVEPNQGISISEPKYPNNGWDVFAKPSGELTFENKKYPYLFWEGASDVSYEQSRRGWVVRKKDVNSFLNSKLAGLGLIQKEINDFKEFWVPEMLKNNKPYYFITFLSQRKIDQIAPLTITPGPDTVIRVMMDYSELEEYEEVEGFNIRTPERSGFTVVEWGGMLK